MRSRGLTLIELLVVIAIIAVLIAQKCRPMMPVYCTVNLRVTATRTPWGRARFVVCPSGHSGGNALRRHYERVA